MQRAHIAAGIAALAGTALLMQGGSLVYARNAPAVDAAQVPVPQQVHARSGPTQRDKTGLVAFDSAPFPYDGFVADTDEPFLNAEEDGRRGHKTPFGRLYWEDETYSDRRVLLHIPKGFDVRRPSVMIVYFHGHGATLKRDVLRRQRVPAQISASGANAVLVAPQLAFNAADSSAGRFWEPGAFARFIDEAARELARLHGDARSEATFAAMPIVIVAYSGGYEAAAWCATRGGISERLRGLVLLDALYGELDKFAAWIEAERSGFFVSTYLSSTKDKNAELVRVLEDREVSFATALGRRLAPGSVTIFPGGETATHHNLLTHAWVDYPLADLLRRLREYRR